MVRAGKGAKVGEQKRDYKLPGNTEGSTADKERLVQKPRPGQTSRSSVLVDSGNWLLHCCHGVGEAVAEFGTDCFLCLLMASSSHRQNRGHIRDRNFIPVSGHWGQVVGKGIKGRVLVG